MADNGSFVLRKYNLYYSQVAISDTATHTPQHAKGPKYQYKTQTHRLLVFRCVGVCAHARGPRLVCNSC
jgi:hypothetical protein